MPDPDPTPSKAARRAAETIHSEGIQRLALATCDHDPTEWPRVQKEIYAEIIERETGAGEAVELIEALSYFLTLREPEDEPDYQDRVQQARAFLQKHNQ